MLSHTNIQWFMIIKNCYGVATSYPVFVGIGVALPLFRAWDSTTHFQNELKLTLVHTVADKFFSHLVSCIIHNTVKFSLVNNFKTHCWQIFTAFTLLSMFRHDTACLYFSICISYLHQYVSSYTIKQQKSYLKIWITENSYATNTLSRNASTSNGGTSETRYNLPKNQFWLGKLNYF